MKKIVILAALIIILICGYFVFSYALIFFKALIGAGLILIFMLGFYTGRITKKNIKK